MFTNKKSPNKDATILDTSILAICSGVIVCILYPPFALFGKVMSLSGLLGTIYYFLTRSKFDKLWKNLGLGIGTAFPMEKSKIIGDDTTVYTFTIPAGISIEDFDKKQAAIECFLGKDIEMKYGYKELILTVYNKARKSIYPYQLVHCKGDLEFPIGYDRLGNLVTCDLSIGEPHMLVAGETGSGKSCGLRSIIANIVLDKPKVKLHLVDLKRGTEFQIFKNCKCVVDYCINQKEAEDMLNKISVDIDRRYDEIVSKGCKDIKEYRKRGFNMEYEMIIVDEYADLAYSDISNRIIDDIGRRARACGIHLVIATQRPSCTKVKGDIKANIGTVLGLKTLNATNSEIIIGTKGLEKLKGNGHGIFCRSKMTEIQCPFLDTDHCIDLIKGTYINKKSTDNEKTKEKVKSGEVDLSDLGILDVFMN